MEEEPSRKGSIYRQFSTVSYNFVRQLSSSSWSSFQSAATSNSSSGSSNRTRSNSDRSKLSLFSFKKKNKSIGVEVTIENIRSLVLLQIFDEQNDDPFLLFHEHDIVKVKSDDYFIDRFIRDGDTDGDHDDIRRSLNGAAKSSEPKDVMKIVKSIIQCLKWRKEVGINGLTAGNFAQEFFNSGLFSIGELCNGNLVMHLNGSQLKYLDMWVEFIIFGFESLDVSVEKGRKFMVLLDAHGVSRGDLLIVLKLLINVLRFYPCLVSRIYIMEMSWIMKSMSKMVLATLPKKYVDMLDFASEDELPAKIGVGNVPDIMGGTVQMSYMSRNHFSIAELNEDLTN